MRKSRRGPSIDASCKILLYLAKMGFREEMPMRPCLLTNIYRRPSIDASYQAGLTLEGDSGEEVTL